MIKINFLKHKFIFGGFIVIAALVLSFLIFKISYSGKIYPGVRVANIQISGLSKIQAQSLLETQINEFEQKEISVSHKEKIVKTTPATLGFQPDLGRTINEAYNLGHKNNPFIDLQEVFQLMKKKGHLTLQYTINQETLDAFLKENFGELEEKARNATLRYEKQDFVLIKSKKGKVIGQTPLQQQLTRNFESLETTAIDLVLVEDVPEITDDEIDTAYNQAYWIIDDEISLTYDKNMWNVPDEQLIQWLEFSPIEEGNSSNKVLGVKINQQKVKNYLEALAAEVNQSPVNAELTMSDDGRVEVFALSQEGRELKGEKNAELITEKLTRWEKQIPLIIDVAKPDVTTDSIKNLGITTLIARGESNFKGSPKNRRLNISVGAKKFNGVLVKPGQEFSFNTILGEVDAAHGYVPELVIKKGKTVPEYGGGLCQVSTTVFRAALNAGVPITERKSHAYVVRYYGTPGMDATIYPPHPDLRFKNDTPGHILIQSKIKGDIITFDFYGTKDGREVKLIGPNLYDAKPDGSVKAVLYRETYKNGELLKKDTFRSNYASPANYPKVPFE